MIPEPFLPTLLVVSFYPEYEDDEPLKKKTIEEKINRKMNFHIRHAMTFDGVKALVDGARSAKFYRLLKVYRRHFSPGEKETFYDLSSLFSMENLWTDN